MNIATVIPTVHFFLSRCPCITTGNVTKMAPSSTWSQMAGACCLTTIPPRLKENELYGLTAADWSRICSLKKAYRRLAEIVTGWIDFDVPWWKGFSMFREWDTRTEEGMWCPSEGVWTLEEAYCRADRDIWDMLRMDGYLMALCLISAESPSYWFRMRLLDLIEEIQYPEPFMERFFRGDSRTWAQELTSSCMGAILSEDDSDYGYGVMFARSGVPFWELVHSDVCGPIGASMTFQAILTHAGPSPNDTVYSFWDSAAGSSGGDAREDMDIQVQGVTPAWEESCQDLSGDQLSCDGESIRSEPEIHTPLLISPSSSSDSDTDMPYEPFQGWRQDSSPPDHVMLMQAMLNNHYSVPSITSPSDVEDNEHQPDVVPHEPHIEYVEYAIQQDYARSSPEIPSQDTGPRLQSRRFSNSYSRSKRNHPYHVPQKGKFFERRQNPEAKAYLSRPFQREIRTPPLEDMPEYEIPIRHKPAFKARVRHNYHRKIKTPPLEDMPKYEEVPAKQAPTAKAHLLHNFHREIRTPPLEDMPEYAIPIRKKLKTKSPVLNKSRREIKTNPLQDMPEYEVPARHAPTAKAHLSHNFHREIRTPPPEDMPEYEMPIRKKFKAKARVLNKSRREIMTPPLEDMPEYEIPIRRKPSRAKARASDTFHREIKTPPLEDLPEYEITERYKPRDEIRPSIHFHREIRTPPLEDLPEADVASSADFGSLDFVQSESSIGHHIWVGDGGWSGEWGSGWVHGEPESHCSAVSTVCSEGTQNTEIGEEYYKEEVVKVVEDDEEEKESPEDDLDEPPPLFVPGEEAIRTPFAQELQARNEAHSNLYVKTRSRLKGDKRGDVKKIRPLSCRSFTRLPTIVIDDLLRMSDDPKWRYVILEIKSNAEEFSKNSRAHNIREWVEICHPRVPQSRKFTEKTIKIYLRYISTLSEDDKNFDGSTHDDPCPGHR
ncbi:hypothetical protein FRC03_011342 [Tulasnella sp. 419]|nr:hypothetical protein FRC03_011342 [Tulasnella sp. 419]